MMTSPKSLFYLMFFILQKSALTADPSSSLHQEKTFISASVGDNITVTCVPRSKQVSKIFWYKQPFGQKPRLMLSFYGSSEKPSFENEWKNNPRFRLEAETNRHHLIIMDVRVSDTGTYYCATSYSFTLEFEEGTLVSVKGSGLTVPALVHQSESEAVQPGGSVTLNCTVHTGGCDGEHSVYWFKDSEESHPGLIYTHGGRNHQCEGRHSTESNTCVYNLPLRSLNVSHAGTYYCAVVSCGHILFGNGTRLDVENKEQSAVLVYLLGGALIFNTILSLFLVSVLFFCYRKKSCNCGGTPASSSSVAQSYQSEENLHYAGLNMDKVGRSRRLPDDPPNQCVYSSVKQKVWMCPVSASLK